MTQPRRHKIMRVLTHDRQHTTACPCGSGKQYQCCCRSVHDNHFEAKTPEALMRARYAAYALGKEDFISATWAIETRPSTPVLNRQTRWIRLSITNTNEQSDTGGLFNVSFKALFIEGDQLGELVETSKFIRRSERWYYLDGEHVVKTRKLSSNDTCPCGSGKKYKRCCKTR